VLRFCDTSGQMEGKVSQEGEWPWGFTDVDLFLCCFDVTSAESLQNVKTKWAPLVRKLCLDVPIVRRTTHRLPHATLTS
jgi:GTPase SAR1 family protein